MTRAEILALPAGRELDRLVAEKVMGGTVAESPVHVVGHSTGETCPCVRWPDGSLVYLPFYSADIAAGWQVVERLSARACAIVLRDVRYHSPETPWAVLVDLPDGHDTGDAVAETAPLAICRAALVAVLETGE